MSKGGLTMNVIGQEASIAKTSLYWMPEGKQRRGHPMITWQRMVEKEMKQMGKIQSDIQVMAKDYRRGWIMSLLYTPTRCIGNKRVSQ